ncbi:FAD-binding protein [Spirochaetia bacterium]|nr:FAD-binding protein [Spirochaetia bacterium]
MSDTSFLGKKLFAPENVFDVLIVGTGAAGFNAAVHLYDKGVTNFAILTEDRPAGTSRNTGSDKQTYYKTACAGDAPDSPRAVAETLFSGGSMDGDIALCEAAHSLGEFFHLVSIGVAFPHNTYGEYPGYKTDHDPLQRASSTGPYTSRHMTEQLEKEAERRGIRIIDKTRVVKLLTDTRAGRVYGVLCLDTENSGTGGNSTGETRFTLYLAKNIIFAAGGPAGLYRDTVYPIGHFGASGVLAQEGVLFANITEWQYGIGSIAFRWNLSGSYQQVIPRYVAVDNNGVEEEFLCGYFSTIEKLGAAVFRKGYQWPFDPAKISGEGSSLIDYAIYIEKHLKGKRIYLDFMHNPVGNGTIGAFDIQHIDAAAKEYLSQSNASGALPIDRLLQLNPQAYELYKSHGIDLAKEYLEIDVLPQHHNGGAAVNIWWETSLQHLFAAGECAGTHGVKRPGGSALNAGQVGGLRAASYIAGHCLKDDNYFDDIDGILLQAKTELAQFEKECERIRIRDAAGVLRDIQSINTSGAAFLRARQTISEGIMALNAIAKKAADSSASAGAAQATVFFTENPASLFCLKETLILSRLLHEAILYYINRGGKSRGSYMILDTVNKGTLKTTIETDTIFAERVLLSRYDRETDTITNTDRPVHPIPDSDIWFERVWRDYRMGTIFGT